MKRSATVLICSAILAPIAAWWVGFKSPLPFVESWWKVDINPRPLLQTRYRIADRLASSDRLIGMTRQQIIAMLGSPSSTDKWLDHGLVYVLGPERGLFSIDYEWLLIDFDASGKASKVDVVTD